MVRQRLSASERRRQLLSIGLSQLSNVPIHDLSMDKVADEAGISRGLLFHYFPTKSHFYIACLEAAGRRMLRNTAPASGDDGDTQVASILRSTIQQIDRRRELYLALIREAPNAPGGHQSVREVSADRVMAALGLSDHIYPVVRAWWAYIEDVTLSWSAVPVSDRQACIERVVTHCLLVLDGLLKLPPLAVTTVHEQDAAAAARDCLRPKEQQSES